MSSQHHSSSLDYVDNGEDSLTSYGSLPATMVSMPAPQLSLHVVPDDCEATESWEQLQEVSYFVSG